MEFRAFLSLLLTAGSVVALIRTDPGWHDYDTASSIQHRELYGLTELSGCDEKGNAVLQPRSGGPMLRGVDNRTPPINLVHSSPSPAEVTSGSSSLYRASDRRAVDASTALKLPTSPQALRPNMLTYSQLVSNTLLPSNSASSVSSGEPAIPHYHSETDTISHQSPAPTSTSSSRSNSPIRYIAGSQTQSLASSPHRITRVGTHTTYPGRPPIDPSRPARTPSTSSLNLPPQELIPSRSRSLTRKNSGAESVIPRSQRASSSTSRESSLDGHEATRLQRIEEIRLATQKHFPDARVREPRFIPAVRSPEQVSSSARSWQQQQQQQARRTRITERRRSL